jgi:hypothetical protein
VREEGAEDGADGEERRGGGCGCWEWARRCLVF